MKSAAVPLLVSIAHPFLTSASPLQPRADVICGRNDIAKVGPYTLYNNLWGQPSGVGSQCTTIGGLFTPDVAVATDPGDSNDAAAAGGDANADGYADIKIDAADAPASADGANEEALKWSTAWTWSGNTATPKSFAFASLEFEPLLVSDIESIPSEWSWNYSGDGIVANVAYSLLTSSDCHTRHNYEITVWLATRGAPYIEPISATPGSALVDSVSLAGWDWALHHGISAASTVFSFVAASDIPDFNGDLHEFVRYLNESGLLPAEQCLFSIGAGTEVFGGGGAVLNTDFYRAAVHSVAEE